MDDLFWKDFCDNYIEIVKERLYQPETHGEEARRSAQYAAYYSLLAILKMYAVYVPHITEYIYQKGLKQFAGAASIHQLLWEADRPAEESILEFGDIIKTALAAVRRYKSEQSLSMKDPVDIMTVWGKRSYEAWFEETLGDLKACSHADRIVYEYAD